MLRGYKYKDGGVIVSLPTGRTVRGEMDANNVVWFSEKDAVRVYIYSRSWWIDVVPLEYEMDITELRLTENDAKTSAFAAIDGITRLANVWNGIITQKEFQEYRNDRFDDIQKDIIDYFNTPDGSKIDDRSPNEVDIAAGTRIIDDILAYFDINSLSDKDKRMLEKHTPEILRKHKIIYSQWLTKHPEGK